MSRLCPRCGVEMKEGAKFCSRCGYEYNHGKICPNCRATIKDDAQFCTNCGYKFNTSAKFQINPLEIIICIALIISSFIIPTIAIPILITLICIILLQKKGKWYKMNKALRRTCFTVATLVVIIFATIISGSDSEDYSLSTNNPKNNMKLENVIKRYVDISQSKFSEHDIENKLSEDNLSFHDDFIDGFNWDNYSVMFTETLQVCSYEYKGMITDPGAVYFFANEDLETLGVSCWMDISYISGNDNFLSIILDSLLIAYSPDLSQEEIQDIKEQFSMQDRLIGAVTRNQYGAYDYKGNTYIVDITENYLTFNIFNSDTIQNIN